MGAVVQWREMEVTVGLLVAGEVHGVGAGTLKGQFVLDVAEDVLVP